MSEKYSAELEKKLEEIREDIGFYLERFEKTDSRVDERRFYFSVMKYYEILLKENNSDDNKILYERAKENYNRTFPSGEIFSPNRKA